MERVLSATWLFIHCFQFSELGGLIWQVFAGGRFLVPGLGTAPGFVLLQH
jgi:hypothetical protein